MSGEQKGMLRFFSPPRHKHFNAEDAEVFLFNALVSGFGVEYFIDPFAEEFAEFEREDEAGRVPSGFQRNDCLPRHADTVRKICLRPIILGTQNFQAIFHR